MGSRTKDRTRTPPQARTSFQTLNKHVRHFPYFSKEILPLYSWGEPFLTEHLWIQREDGCWQEPQQRDAPPQLLCWLHRGYNAVPWAHSWAMHWDSEQTAVSCRTGQQSNPGPFMVTGWLLRYMPGQNKHLCKKKKIPNLNVIFLLKYMYLCVFVCMYMSMKAKRGCCSPWNWSYGVFECMSHKPNQILSKSRKHS